MPGNPLVRFDEGRVGRTARCRPLSYSTGKSLFSRFPVCPGPPDRRESPLQNEFPRRLPVSAARARV